MDTLCKALIFVPLFGGLAACGESQAPESAPVRAAKVSHEGGVASYPTVALGSGTGSASDLRGAAGLVPDDEAVTVAAPRGHGGAFGVGIRPGPSASGIRP